MIPLATPGDGVRATLQRTARVDRQVRQLLARHIGTPHGFAVLGVGGYGRGDLTLLSDLDLLLIDDPAVNLPEEAIRRVIQELWDAGYKPGQTLLNIAELDESLLRIPDRASNVLESRWIWGDRDILERFEAQLNTSFRQQVYEAFLREKSEEFHHRREKFGPVVRVLEPHLKNQAGGLRDLHHSLWMERAASARRGQWKLVKRRGFAIQGLLNRLRHQGVVTPEEARDLLAAYDTLLRIREALRGSTQRAEDVLHIPDQPCVGRALGFPGGDDRVVRDLMRHLILAGERISRFSREYTLLPSGRRWDPLAGRPLEGLPGARQLGGMVDLTPQMVGRYARSPQLLGSLIDRAAREGALLTGRTRHALRRAIHRQPGRCHDPVQWRSILSEWLETPRHFSARMRLLDHLDCISLLIPEWSEITGLSTGSYYHRYTVDEHTLRALERLDDLPSEGEAELPASIWRECSVRPIVYLAVLFHDIAKGRRGEHSIEGAQVATEALTRLGLEQWALPVAKLVRIHLRMEQIAFRRDHRDPLVIGRLAEMTGDEDTLRALYLLTVCDLSAVSPHVWSSWKGHLLAELYQGTAAWLREGPESSRYPLEEELERVLPLALDKGQSAQRAREFLHSMQEEYRRAIPAREIVQHLQWVERVAGGEIPFRWLSEDQGGYIVTTLITQDQSGLLAMATGLLLSLGIGIREARIFTREDGLVIDRFRGEDRQPNGVPLTERLGSMESVWQELASGQLEIEALVLRHVRRRRFQRKPVGRLESEIAITPVEGGSVIDVSGRDSEGLLYRLCRVLTEQGLSIRAARATVRLDGILDTFLVRDRQGVLEERESLQDVMDALREAVEQTQE